MVGFQVRDSLRGLLLGSSRELAQSVVGRGEHAAHVAAGGCGLDGEAYDIVGTGG